jgi:hypothetical protein
MLHTFTFSLAAATHMHNHSARYSSTCVKRRCDNKPSLGIFFLFPLNTTKKLHPKPTQPPSQMTNSKTLTDFPGPWGDGGLT